MKKEKILVYVTEITIQTEYGQEPVYIKAYREGEEKGYESMIRPKGIPKKDTFFSLDALYQAPSLLQVKEELLQYVGNDRIVKEEEIRKAA